MSKESALKVLHELTAAGLLSSDAVTRFSEEIESGSEALLTKLVAEEVITQFQADKFRDGKAADICFGDYVLINELGRGGMGTVFLARHRLMDREVAIKILPVTTMESEAAVARFYQEVKVAGKLKHPNIVHAYDAREHQGFHYLVMEFVDGHDLAHVAHEIGPLPLEMTLDYVRQACLGLQWAHSKDVIHRDIKPSNLLLDGEGNVKVLDMGLARIDNGGLNGKSIHLTTTGQVMGTVEYMSPEQAEDTRLADARSDIYSLGCTLYRLLSNSGPYSRDTVVKTILAHRNDPVPLLPATGDPRHDAVQKMFAKMVAKDPDDRYQTVDEILQAIDLLDADVGEESYPDVFAHAAAKTDSTPVSAPAPATAPTAASVSTAASEKNFARTAVAIRIEEDGSMTNLPGSAEPRRAEVIDLTDENRFHDPPVATPATAHTDNAGEIFRIDDDPPSRKRLFGFIGLAVLSLVTIFGTSFPAIIVGFLILWFARTKLKKLIANKSRDGLAIQSQRVRKWCGIVLLVIGIVLLTARGF